MKLPKTQRKCKHLIQEVPWVMANVGGAYLSGASRTLPQSPARSMGRTLFLCSAPPLSCASVAWILQVTVTAQLTAPKSSLCSAPHPWTLVGTAAQL